MSESPETMIRRHRDGAPIHPPPRPPSGDGEPWRDPPQDIRLVGLRLSFAEVFALVASLFFAQLLLAVFLALVLLLGIAFLGLGGAVGIGHLLGA